MDGNEAVGLLLVLEMTSSSATGRNRGSGEVLAIVLHNFIRVVPW